MLVEHARVFSGEMSCGSFAQSCLALYDPMDCSIPGCPVLHCPVSQSLLTPLSDESVMPCNHLILCDSSSPSALNISQSGSFPVSWFLASGGQSIGASGSASGLPMNVQGSHALGLTGFISLQHSGLTRVFAATTVQKQQFFGAQPSLRSSSHIHT